MAVDGARSVPGIVPIPLMGSVEVTMYWRVDSGA